MRGDHQRLVPRFHAHLHDVWSRLATSIPGGWVGEAGGLRCIATGSPSPSFNLALSGDGVRDPQLALDRAHQRFEEAGLRWLLKLQPERDQVLVAHARARGLHFEEEPVYGMALRSWAAPRTSPSPLTIRLADGRIDDAVLCLAEGFDADRESLGRELGANLLTVPTFTVFVGYLDGEPVAT